MLCPPVPVKAGPRWFEGWLMVYNSTPAARFHLSKFEAVSAINLCMHWHCVPCPQYPVYIIIIIPPTLALLWTKQSMEWRLINLVLFLVIFRPSSSRHNPTFVVRANLINFMCLIYRWRENNLVHTEQIVCGIFRFSFYFEVQNPFIGRGSSHERNESPNSCLMCLNESVHLLSLSLYL